MNLAQTKQFKKDVKRMQKRGKPLLYGATLFSIGTPVFYVFLLKKRFPIFLSRWWWNGTRLIDSFTLQ